MEDNETLALTPYLDEKSKTFNIIDYDTVKGGIEAYIKTQNLFKFPIDDEERKLCKKERENLNKKIKVISDFRKQAINFIVGDFEAKMKELEAMLKQVSDEHGESLYQYDITKDPSKVKVPKVKITCTSTDSNVINQIEMYAIKLGCEVKRG